MSNFSPNIPEDKLPFLFKNSLRCASILAHSYWANNMRASTTLVFFFSIVSFNFRSVKKEMIFPLPFSTYGFKIREKLFKDSKRRAGKGEDRAKVLFAIQERVSSKFCLFKKVRSNFAHFFLFFFF